jgi:hypothetical protein
MSDILFLRFKTLLFDNILVFTITFINKLRIK